MKEDMPRRLNHFTPLRYPGGKAKLAPFVKALLASNDLEDGWYAEPFAGGAGIAAQLLLQGYVSNIAINDVSLPVFSFWQAIKNEPTRFADRIRSVDLSVEEWDRQKAILKSANPTDAFALGFATFYLNRTNRSGVLSGGIIGGRRQAGEWLIDARFNRTELAYRVERLGRLSKSIHISCSDAIEFLEGLDTVAPPDKTLIYADPPYFEKGRQLYLDYYVEQDHTDLAKFMTSKLDDRFWLVSYDDVPQIRKIYEEQRLAAYAIPYSVRAARMGSEVMFYSQRLCIPDASDPGVELGPADRFAHV